MRKSLEFYFDFGSPSSYLAHTQLAGIASRSNAALVYRPILMGALFKASGNTSPITVPAKGRYLVADLQRCAKRMDVPFTLNPHFPFVTLPIMRLATALQAQEEQAVFERFTDAVFRAIWVDGRNLGDIDEAAAVIGEAGLDAPRVLPLAEAPDVKARLKEQTDEAVARGVFGAPTFFVGQEMFWGQDRLDFVEDALCSQASV